MVLGALAGLELARCQSKMDKEYLVWCETQDNCEELKRDFKKKKRDRLMHQRALEIAEVSRPRNIFGQ